MPMKLIGTRRSLLLDSPYTVDGPFTAKPAIGHTPGGGGSGHAGEPIGLLLALTKSS